MFWLGICVVVALVVGVGLARDVSGRVGKLRDGTVALAGGKFDARLDAQGADEVAELAGAFNKMAGDLGAATAELARWNAELEQRVAQKTRELKEAQDMLLRARSLAAMGTLGAGVAHEINNPLTGVLGAAQLLLMDHDKDSPDGKLLTDIEEQAQRIRRIVANLLRVAQRESGDELLPLDLNRVVDDALSLVGTEDLRRARIAVDKKLNDDVPPVRGNPLLLQEAVMELLTNARRAMPDGGTITVATEVPDKRLVAVRVTDTGKGIAPDIIDKIFDPFFTTKADWQSTGLGLTRVHKIVTDHNGDIKVDSVVGAGATFVMTFPADAGRAHLE
jgi:signal transduction histidine kinase